MHAFLLISQNSNVKPQIEDLAKKLKAKIFEFPLAKIEDVRNLNNLIRLSFNEPTLVVSENIHEATEEALNAFLKNLEEPQENIYFALTAPSSKKVLATIVSRCQIIRVDGKKQEVKDDKDIEKFLSMTVSEKFEFVDKIKDRKKAIELAENTVNLLHRRLHENDVKYTVTAKNIEAASQTLTRLKANGNVNLQLANFIINLENGD